jgi:hypothetical protein
MTASYNELEQEYLELTARLPAAADLAGLSDDELDSVIALTQQITDCNIRMTAMILRDPVMIRYREMSRRK